MNNNETSRRDFLRTACKGAVSIAAVSMVPSFLTTASAEGAEAPAWPWTWHPLDKQKVMERVYTAFPQVGGCCASVVAGILGELADEYGYPYNQIEPRMFANGGGGYGAQTLCGSLGGACAVIGLFCEPKRSGAIRNEVFAWYKEHAFPQYQPEITSVYTVSESIQCADSVGNWMKESGNEFASPERIARCSGVSAEVAAKVCELLDIEYGYAEAPVEEPVEAGPVLAPGEYIGEGDSFGGKVKVKVTMEGSKIAKIEVLEHGDTAGVCDKAYETIPQAIIDAQSVDVDVASGATLSSKGIMEAVANALKQID